MVKITWTKKSIRVKENEASHLRATVTAAFIQEVMSNDMERFIHSQIYAERTFLRNRILIYW
jgi:hypothetical protein